MSAVDNSSLSSSLLALVVMIGALAALPWLLKRWQQRLQARQGGTGMSAQVLASVVVGPNQRVVTVEVGEGPHKTRLVLGVTQQNIHCLHVLGQPAGSAVASSPSFSATMAQVQGTDLPPQL